MSKKKKILAAVALLVLAAALAAVYALFSPSAQAGGKTIELAVTHLDGTVKTFTVETDSESLRGALEQEGLIAGDESEYGLYVTQVDGETADAAQRQWWCFTKGGELLATGVDDTLIADGENYEAFIDVY